MNLTEHSRLMVFAPHPGDETLRAGGLLQLAQAAGAAVRVVFATDGEHDSWPKRAAERSRWGSRRREEALAALECLRLTSDSATFLSLADRGLTDLLLKGDEKPIAQLAAEIGEWRPTLVVAPSLYDIHPDHSALAVLLHLACLKIDPDQPRVSAISYIAHSRSAAFPSDDAIEVSLVPEQLERKRRAVFCHATQVKWSKRRLLKLAGRTERFFPAGAPTRELTGHPVRKAAASFTTLRLEVATRARLGAFGGRALFLVGGATTGERVRLFTRLPTRSGEANVYEVGESDVICRASFSGKGEEAQIQLPLSAVPQVDKLFVKIERRFGFFDEAGWREVPLPRKGISKEGGDVEDGQGVSGLPSACCVIPCYNVSAHCREVITGAASIADQVIVINDGSEDETNEILREIAAEHKNKVRVISFVKNRGKGVALLTGFRYALKKLAFDVIVTLDGDGQHDPSDIPRFVKSLRDENADLVVGQRTVGSRLMPLRSRLVNRIFGFCLRRRYPCSLLDTRCGFRAIEPGFVKEIVSTLRGGRYETELHVLMLALERRKQIVTLPIETIYHGKNVSSHFRFFADGFRIYRAIRNFRSLVSLTPGADM